MVFRIYRQLREHWDAIAKALKPVYAAPTEAAALGDSPDR